MFLAVIDDPNYTPSSIRDRAHVFPFPSLDEARDALHRLDQGAGWGYLTTLDGQALGMAQFGYLADPTMTLWQVPDGVDPADHWATLAADPDPYPDYRIERERDADTGCTIEADGPFLVSPC